MRFDYIRNFLLCVCLLIFVILFYCKKDNIIIIFPTFGQIRKHVEDEERIIVNDPETGRPIPLGDPHGDYSD